MHMTVRARQVDLDPAMQAHAERRLHFALGRFADAIKRVELRVGDVNGPRGGIDKRCRLVVGLRRAGDVVLDDADADLEALLDRIADRAGRAVGRRLERERVVMGGRDAAAWRGA